MKTLICEKPYHFKQIETEEPVRNAGEAIVRIRRIGICGTDLHAYEGAQPFFEYPRILGHELSGEIEEIGDNPQGLKAGDRVSVIPYLACGTCIACRSGKTNCCTGLKVLGVHTDGGMREKIAVPQDRLIAVNGMPIDHAAMIEPLGIGAHAVRRADPAKGEQALVIGAGPIGLGVMLFAKQAGAHVIAMDINEERLAFCRDWAQVDAAVDARRDPHGELKRLTNGEYPTVVFDATGNAKSMMAAFQYAAHGGRLIYVGLIKGDISFSDPEFHKRELTLLSSRNATRADFERVIETLQAGASDLDRYITHHSSFDAMIGQFDSWLKPETKVIKAIVEL